MVKGLEVGRCLSGPNRIIKTCNQNVILIRANRRITRRTEAEVRGVKMLCCWLDDGGRGCEPRNANSL